MIGFLGNSTVLEACGNSQEISTYFAVFITVVLKVKSVFRIVDRREWL